MEAGRASPVPGLDLTGVGAGPAPPRQAPAAQGGSSSGSRRSARDADGNHQEDVPEPAFEQAESEPPAAFEEEAEPGPPPELEQLHALGDKKFGRGKTVGRRPPAAPGGPSAGEEKRQARRVSSSGYGKLNPNSVGGRPNAQALRDSIGGEGDSTSDRSVGSNGSGSNASPNTSGSRSPAPRKPNVKNVASSGYGQRSRSASQT